MSADSPPAFGELCELSLLALINAPGAFARLEARPAPKPASSFLLALAWGGVFFALNLVRAALSNPAFLHAFAPWQIAAAGVLGLFAWTALYLLGASFVYGLGRTLGSAGDFDRALLVAALALAAAPAQALFMRFPAAWMLPTILAAWITACGLNALFKAGPWAARGVCAAPAALVLALVYGAGQLADKYSDSARLAVIAAQAAAPQDQLSQLQMQMLQVQSAEGSAPGANQPAVSGLDLLRGPEASPAAAAGEARDRQIDMSASGDAMSRSVVDMLDSIAPILANPAVTKNMTPQQKSDYAELQSSMQELKMRIAKKTSITPSEQQAQMMKIQRLVMRMMSAGIGSPKADRTGDKR